MVVGVGGEREERGGRRPSQGVGGVLGQLLGQFLERVVKRRLLAELV